MSEKDEIVPIKEQDDGSVLAKIEFEEHFEDDEKKKDEEVKDEAGEEEQQDDEPEADDQEPEETEEEPMMASGDPEEVVEAEETVAVEEGVELSTEETVVEEIAAVEDAVELSTEPEPTLDAPEEVQEENELLLLQLHQVQEELEHHFLEHQKLQRENEGLQKRWMRLEERDPQYFDYESIYPVLVDTVSEKPRLDWRANEVIIEGKVTPQFLFTTFLRDGMPGIEVTTSEGDETENPICIIPE